ncbi:hypothetical protein MUN81_16805 [Hymenobacter sp. 5317J-9]|uniref:hypothetical protein n=1 Tax=Hymenobacter sp. 5317J-9 TaxID=2932250 RepID=UPI001FD66720|nr:hypothetical protein [Hymenobacter sp. 5317J-9]UOQ96894.1 hypothetical protein MUN81_16805 [Hymenobacter sp. 5317J-9]
MAQIWARRALALTFKPVFQPVALIVALRRLPLPGALLLGLLALLLWGACGNQYQAPACCGERVVRVDSLAAPLPDAPPLLYLTLGLRNDDPDAARLESVSGALLFQGLYWSDFHRPRRQGLVVPPKKELLVPLVLPLTDTLACDPVLLRRLQRALRRGTAGDSTLWLNLSVDVSLKEGGGYLSDNGTEVSLPAMGATVPLRRK